MKRHITTTNRSRACTAVSGKHIAIDRDRALTQRNHVDHATQRSPDEPLDFLVTTRCPAPNPLWRRPRKHRILRGNPPLSATPHPTWRVRLNRSRAQHLCLTKRDEHRTHRHLRIVTNERHRPQFIEHTSVVARDSHGCSKGVVAVWTLLGQFTMCDIRHG